MKIQLYFFSLCPRKISNITSLLYDGRRNFTIFNYKIFEFDSFKIKFFFQCEYFCN
jgi:hypothetical protein